MARQRTIQELVAAIKAAHAKAEKADAQVAKADEQKAAAAAQSAEHWKSVGTMLAELKARKPKGVIWPDYVKKQCNYSQQRADELIRLAGGKITLEDMRTQKAESKAKSKAKKKSNTTDGGSVGSKPSGEVVRFGEFKNRAGKIKKACDFNVGDPDDVAEDGDTPEQTRRQIFLNMVHYWGINEPTKVLDESFFPKASPEEATDDLFVEIEKVIAAWNVIANKLRALKGAQNAKVKVRA